MDEEIKLKKKRKEIEDEKEKQKQLYNEEKFMNDQEVLYKRYEDERRRELAIDYSSVAKNREKFEKVFLHGEGKPKRQRDKRSEDDDVKDHEGREENIPKNADTGENPTEKLEEAFDEEAIFRRKKPAYSVENSKLERPNFETSFASNEVEQPLHKLKSSENNLEYQRDLDEIKRRQQRNILGQMEVENEYRPHVIGNAPIQGYGLNRNPQKAFDSLVQQ